MHSSQDAQAEASAIVRPLFRLGDLSFPPTQRTGLLGSPAAPSATSPKRSRYQDENLKRSGARLIDLMSIQPLRHAAQV